MEDFMKLLFIGLIVTATFGEREIWAQPAATSSATVNPPAASATVSGETTQPPPPSKPPVSLRIVGSNLMNPQGQYLGRIEEAMLNSSNQLEFALIATAYPTNDAVLTPVPWTMLSHVWDQSKAGGTPGAVQTFIAPVDKTKLDMAPKISRNHRTDLPPDWVQRVYAFYGETPGAIGAAGSATASASGAGSGGTAAAGTTTTPSGVAVGAGEGVAIPPIVYTDPGGFIVGFPGTNTVTNTLLPTNIVGSNIFVGGSNVFVGGSNIFAGGTNVFPGGTNGFVGATNIFEGGGASNASARPLLAPNTNFTIQGSNSTQMGRPTPGGPQFTPSDLNRRQNSGTASGSGTVAPTTPPQSTAPAENPPPSGVAPGNATPRPAPMAPAPVRK
jgi:hypothetical protein